MTELLSDFVPVTIIDTSTVHFCTYCFRATDNNNVHIKDCTIGEFTEVMPEFWPTNWWRLKCLDFKYNVCYFPDCKKPLCSSKAKNIIRHFKSSKHLNQVLFVAADEIRSDVINRDGAIQASRNEPLSNTDVIRIASSDDEVDSEVTKWSKPCTQEGKNNVESNDISAPDEGNDEFASIDLVQPLVLTDFDTVLEESNHCDESLDSEELVIHNETNHNSYLLSKNQPMVKCKFCSYKTSSKNSMALHIASLHYTLIFETLVNTADETRTYRCITCDIVAESKQAAAKHYVSSHIDFPTVKCELCEVEVKEKKYLVGHLKTQMHREYYRRSIRCRGCQFATLSKKALQKHEAAIHSQGRASKPKEKTGKLACDKCNYVAGRFSDMTAHKKRVHGFQKGEDGLYSCNECDFKCGNKEKLIYHTKVAPDHIAAKNSVRCDICNFTAFNLPGMLYHKFMMHRSSKSE